MRVEGPSLDVVGVTKDYGSQRALDGVDLSVASGEIVALLGPNGAGKSTLVSIVAGLLRPSSGSVSVAGVDVCRQPHRAQAHLGLAPQDLAVYLTLTVRQNLAFMGALAGLGSRATRASVDEVTAALGLVDLLDRPARHLSGGQQRRLHTAMALVHQPRVVLLDEPTVGADVSSRQALVAFVRRLAAEGAAVVYTTHHLDEIEALGASLAVIDRGRIVEQGPLAELVGRHAAHGLELRFDGPLPVALTTDRDRCRPVDGGVRLHTDDPSGCLAELLPTLGDDAARLTGVEVIRPSLEAAFLALTGRPDDQADRQADDLVDDGGNRAAC